MPLSKVATRGTFVGFFVILPFIFCTFFSVAPATCDSLIGGFLTLHLISLNSPVASPMCLAVQPSHVGVDLQHASSHVPSRKPFFFCIIIYLFLLQFSSFFTFPLVIIFLSLCCYACLLPY